MNFGFSRKRLFALVAKEFIQVLRDRLTFAMLVGIPVMQITLFGFAINTDPHHLPMAVLVEDHSPFARSLVAALEATDYFTIAYLPRTEAGADLLMARNQAQFILRIPPDFGRDLVRGADPSIQVEADATDPVATVNAEADSSSIRPRWATTSRARWQRWRPPTRRSACDFTTATIRRGVAGQHRAWTDRTIFTMTLVMMTAVAITRERERGTFESLLATTARPIEVMLAKSRLSSSSPISRSR